MRYNKTPFIQPTRIIKPASTDVIHTMTKLDNLDTLAAEYYDDPTLSWIIMCANPDFFLEFDIPVGAKVRIPLPIDRVWTLWGETVEI